MKKPTTISKESVSEYREFVQLRLRKRILEAIEVVLEEEVNQALGCGSYERAEDRRGYRNGAETRRVTTSVGTRELRVPRARVRDEETGETTEFRRELLPRYARRTREVDEAILGTYLSGANSRRIRKALKPLLGEEHLSKSAVSRVVSRLKERFEEWQNRALSEEVYAIVYLDGFHLKVRMAKRVISVLYWFSVKMTARLDVNATPGGRMSPIAPGIVPECSGASRVKRATRAGFAALDAPCALWYSMLVGERERSGAPGIRAFMRAPCSHRAHAAASEPARVCGLAPTRSGWPCHP